MNVNRLFKEPPCWWFEENTVLAKDNGFEVVIPGIDITIFDRFEWFKRIEMSDKTTIYYANGWDCMVQILGSNSDGVRIFIQSQKGESGFRHLNNITEVEP